LGGIISAHFFSRTLENFPRCLRNFENYIKRIVGYNLTANQEESIMKKLLTLIVICGLTANLAYAGAQQNKMKSCNADAKTKALKGDERKAFMKDCLSVKPEATGTSQQNKMKTCNADASAKSLKGDERKAFMKACLSGK
jgi:uncharacterized protein HemX